MTSTLPSSKELERAGWTTKRSGKGHVIAFAPGGGSTVIDGTPSDHRTEANTRANLKRLGFDPTQPDEKKRSRQQRSYKAINEASVANRALEALRQHQERSYSTSEVAALVKSDPASTNAALSYLVKRHPCVHRVSRGLYRYHEPKETPAPATKAPESPRMFEEFRKITPGILLIRDENGRVWVATPHSCP